MTAATTFAEWAAGYDSSALAPALRGRVLDAIRDAIGCGIHGSTLPWSVSVREALATMRGGDATVIGTMLRLPAPLAALANGVSIHAFELDDLNERAPGVHATASIVPAVLAASEMRPVEGPDLLASAVVGHEVAVRLSRCLTWSAVERGFHTPALLGAVAAAVSTGRALRQPPEVLSRTIAIAALQAGGLLAAKRHGMVKRLYAGRAAEIGLTAALLAGAGCEAPDDVFEGPGGFCESYAGAGRYELAALTDDLGEDLAVGGIQFKLYAACGMVHAALDALRDLRAAEPDVDPVHVRDVVVALSPTSCRAVGEPYRGGDATTAQFSLAYAVAVTLLEGDASIAQFREELLRDDRVLQLAERVHPTEDSTFESFADRNAARVSVHLDGGRVLERGHRVARGGSDRPASGNELARKFRSLATPVLGPDRVAELERVLARSDTLPDVARVARLVAVPQR